MSASGDLWCLGGSTVFGAAQPLHPKKVLVTGGTGLLGRPVIRELRRRGFHVVSLSSKPFDKLHRDVQILFASLRVTHLGMDLKTDVESSEGSQLQRAIKDHGVDLVINLAADRGGEKWDGVKGKMNNSVLNTALPACLGRIANHQDCRLFHISTEYVWSGDRNQNGYPPVAIDKDSRFVQDEKGAPYALQKKAAEEALGAVGGERVTIIRLPVLYGPMLNALEDGTSSSSISNLLSDNNFLHDKWQRRYPTSSEDCAFVIGALATKVFRGCLQHSVYNYGAQESVSKYDFMKLFAETVQLPIDRIKSENAELRPEKRPPYDVQLDICATRAELEADREWVEPRRLHAATIKTIWLPFFMPEVEALKVQILQSDLKALIEAVQHELGCAARVGILGGPDFVGIGSERRVKAVAKSLSAKLQDQAVFVLDGTSKLHEVFARHCTESQVRNVVFANRTGKSGRYRIGRDIEVSVNSQHWDYMRDRIANIYIVFEGGEDAWQRAQSCSELGARIVPCVPFRALRPAALKLQREALKRLDVHGPKLAKLLKDEDPHAEELAKVVTELISPVVETKFESLRRCRSMSMDVEDQETTQ